MLRGKVGRIWGPSPQMLAWAYKAMVRPLISYCSFAWAQALTKKQNDQLASLQRLALMLTGSYHPGTPTEGLNIIFDTMPIDLYIKSEVIKARVRLEGKLDYTWKGKSFGKALGHITYADKLKKETKLPSNELDKKNKEPMWDKKYTVNKESYNNGNDILTGYRCYTDGSKMSDDCGAGALLMNGDHTICTISEPLGKQNTVFQAEIIAIAEGYKLVEVELNNGRAINKVNFLSDSQAALKALANLKINSKCVLAAANCLNELGKKTTVELHWIKAHVDHPGNETADKLAKEGTKKLQTATYPITILFF